MAEPAESTEAKPSEASLTVADLKIVMAVRVIAQAANKMAEKIETQGAV